MPNIFKNFLRPPVNPYVFQDVEDIPVEAETPEQPEEEEAPILEERSPVEEECSNANTVISFAKVQADEIVADARRQAEEILEGSRRLAAEEAENLREEARTEGYRQGYGEGLRKAQVEGQAQMEEERCRQIREVQDFLEQACAAREDMLSSTQAELRDLSIAVAEKVIHVSLKSSREVIARMIQVATEKLKRREWVHIYVGGYTAKELAPITPELMTALAGLSEHIKLIPMQEDEPGTCIIEMPDEIIDASTSTQLQNIREILSKQ